MPTNATLREHCEARVKVLQRQRQSWEPAWRDLSRFIDPKRGQFFTQPNSGDRGRQNNGSILDPTALHAKRALVAGLMSGVTSPARPWFRLTVPDRRVAQLANVKAWFDDAAERMRMVFAAGNLYSALPIVYDELGQFGVGCAILEFDREDVIRLYTQSTGEYWLGIDGRGRVNTFARRFMKSYRQIEELWPNHGVEEISEKAKSDTEADTEIVLFHLIEPNTAYEKGRLDSAGKKFRSIVWREGSKRPGELVHRSGYNRFPVLAPRWAPIGNDAYSRSPGHDALPDVKSLQVFTKRLHNAVDKHVNPPMGAHISLRGTPSSVLPGATNYFTSAEKGSGMWPLYQTQPGSIEQVRAQIADSRQSIDRAFFADLFLMISQMEGVQPRNQLEISTRREEKMQMLGPVLENLHDDLLQPLVQQTFDIMFENRLFLEPPEELQGYPLDVELISILAQAQKAADLGSMERVFQFAGGLAGVRPDVLDKLDFDEAIDVYGDKLGAPSAIIVSDDQVAKMRQARAQQQAQEKAIATATVAADGAKTLSETDVGGGRNALQAVLGL